ASLREHGHGEYRLKTPMKLVGNKYERISWDQALNEISAKMLELKKQSGPDSIFVVGSSKHNNEQAYLLRKWMSLWGSNNCDHQARICHSTTVAGVANTWGYGAMTNSYNDMRNTKCAMYTGSNAAEAHPVSMLHMLHAKETGAKMIVVDPRFTRTAAKADVFVRIRSGTDIPFLFGVLHHIFKNGWEDKQYIHDRVYGMDKVREEVMTKWTPDKVEEACGVPEAQVYQVAEMMAKNRPSTLVWCMGQTQHTIGNAIVRASCIVQLALGNIGVSGDGGDGAQGRCVPAAGGHAVRDLRLGHRVESFTAMAREGDRADVRVQARPNDHDGVRQEVRLRRPVRRQAGRRHHQDQGHQGQ